MNRIGIDARLWNETGVGRYIRNLVTELQKIDRENEYVLFIRSQDEKDIQSLLSNEHWSIKKTDIYWHTVQEQLQFGKLLEKECLNLVHFPYFSVPIMYTGKFVLTIHDLILHQFPTGKASTKSWFVYQLKHAAYKFVIAQAAKKAEKIITVSEATKKEIINHIHVSREKIIVTYEGVDKKIKPFDNTDGKNQELRIKNDYGKFFLYVGNSYPHKNLERLVDAFSLSKFSQDNTKLILVGKEDFFYKRLKKKVHNLGLEKHILFKHTVGDEELASLYANALALVMPSLMEGFGLPVLEAMAQNCLVAISDIPVFHEIAEDAGVYFDPKDVKAIQNVLESIAKGNVPDETDKKKKGKEIIIKFSWEKMAQQTLQVYTSCISL